MPQNVCGIFERLIETQFNIKAKPPGSIPFLCVVKARLYLLLFISAFLIFFGTGYGREASIICVCVLLSKIIIIPQ